MHADDAGRRARFEALVSEVGDPLRRYVVRRVDGDGWQDVLADTFLVLWRRLDDVPEGGRLPWAYRVARNCLANQARTEHRRHRLLRRIAAVDPPVPAMPAPEPADPELHAALSRLREDDRELLRLWAWEDLAPGDIAAVLGISANSVSIRLHRARRRLAVELETTGRKAATGAGQEHPEGRRTR
jgi:RNA polymerase sigma-70 factor (ECF subfamily)